MTRVDRHFRGLGGRRVRRGRRVGRPRLVCDRVAVVVVTLSLVGCWVVTCSLYRLVVTCSCSSVRCVGVRVSSLLVIVIVIVVVSRVVVRSCSLVVSWSSLSWCVVWDVRQSAHTPPGESGN